ncbi:NTP transferase domain-containing protein [Paenibacillus tritici]|nr:NTP transferase domain-containing protein [Paenibacillus tritici]
MKKEWRTMKVAGIYLAASRSIGANVSAGSLNRTGDSSPGAAMLRELENCGLEPLVVVVRANDPLSWLPPAENLENTRRIETCLTAHLGLSFSLRCGLNAVSPFQPDAVVIADADQPLIEASYVRRLIHTFEQEQGLDYVAGTREGLQMAPVLFARSLFGGLQELDDGDGIAAIIRSPEYKGITLQEEADRMFTEAELPGSFGKLRWK